jgi:hypothetical protein
MGNNLEKKAAVPCFNVTSEYLLGNNRQIPVLDVP